jgi:citrate lyase subunit beta/citryl-CoA lyase
VTAPPARSYLYAPGDRPDLLRKALAGEADVVVADLEDSVPAGAKARARGNVVALLRDAVPDRLHVRVNAIDSDDGVADLRALAGAGAITVRLPKVGSADDVRRAAALAAEAGGCLALSCLLESAAGVEHAYEVAVAHPAVTAIALGEADLLADLGIAADAADAGLAYARSRIVVAARAAGLPRPVQSVHPHARDLDGLLRTTRLGRALGFFGRSAIHPAQVPVINAACLPTPEEIAAARELVAAATDEGVNVVLPDGRYVDPAVVAGAQATLAWAGARGEGGT